MTLLTWTTPRPLHLGPCHGMLLANLSPKPVLKHPCSPETDSSSQALTATETTWKFQGPLHAPPFNTNFIMPPGVDVQIDLRRSEQLLTVMCANNVTAANRFRPKIVDMRMMVKYVEVAEEVNRAKLSQIDLSTQLKRFQMT